MVQLFVFVRNVSKFRANITLNIFFQNICLNGGNESLRGKLGGTLVCHLLYKRWKEVNNEARNIKFITSYFNNELNIYIFSFLKLWPSLGEHLFDHLLSITEKKYNNSSVAANDSYIFYLLLLFSHLRLSQRIDDPAVGWHKPFFVITLYQKQHYSSIKHL